MSESLGSEVHVPAESGVIKEIRIDESTGATTVKYARCSECGKYLAPQEWWACSGGDFACQEHMWSFDGQPWCRRHFETDVMSKRECKAALLISMCFNPSKSLKLLAMEKDQVADAIAGLTERKMTIVKDCLICKDYKLTDMGHAAMRKGMQVFRHDGDFQLLLAKTGVVLAVS